MRLINALQAAIIDADIVGKLPPRQGVRHIGNGRRVFTVESTSFAMPVEVRAVRHEHQQVTIDMRVPASKRGDGPKLQGGLPPKTRDSSKGFNKYAPVWGVQQHPKVIGSTGGERVIIARRNISTFW